MKAPCDLANLRRGGKPGQPPSESATMALRAEVLDHGLVTPRCQADREHLSRECRGDTNLHHLGQQAVQLGSVRQCPEERPCAHSSSSGGYQGSDQLQMSSQDWLLGADPLDLIDHQGSARAQLGGPAPSDRSRLNQMGEEQPGEDQIGRSRREGELGDVVADVTESRSDPSTGPGQMGLRSVQAYGGGRFSDARHQARRVPGATSQVIGKRDRSGHHAPEEGGRGGAKHLMDQL